MAEGTPEEGSGFGWGVLDQGWTPDEEDPEAAPSQDDPEGSEEDEAPEVSEAEVPEEAPEETPEDEEPPEEAPEPEAAAEAEDTAPELERLYADKFTTVEALESGYREAAAWATRASMENAQLRQEHGRAMQLLQQMAPIVQQKLIEDNPELEEQFNIAQQVNQRVREQMEPLQARQAQQAMTAEIVSNVGAFRSRHPDVPPNSPADHRFAATLQDLQLPVGHPVAMEIAYEAMNDEGLHKVLKANPQLMQSPEGFEVAKAQAARFFPKQRQPVRPKAAVQKAFVETGGTGAPMDGAPGERPDKDSFDKALDFWRSNFDNPIMGGAVPS